MRKTSNRTGWGGGEATGSIDLPVHPVYYSRGFCLRFLAYDLMFGVAKTWPNKDLPLSGRSGDGIMNRFEQIQLILDMVEPASYIGWRRS